MFDVDILHTPPGLALASLQGGATSGVDATRYLLACLVVIGLLCIGAWFLSRLSRGSVIGRAKKRSLQMVDVLPIGRRQRLCVARVYDRTFVLGVGEREVTLVAELDTEDDLAAQSLLESGAENEPAPKSFASLLKGAFSGGAEARRAAAGASTERRLREPAAIDETSSARASDDDVESRAARAAREALLAILDERQAAAAPQPAPKKRVAARSNANTGATTNTNTRADGKPARTETVRRTTRPLGARPAAAGADGESPSATAPRRRPRPKKSAASATAEPERRRAPARRPAPDARPATASVDAPQADEPRSNASSTWVG